jgi:SAM-dependent methyltransferase
VTQIQDFTPITELPGTRLNQEQWYRFTHRYAFGAARAVGRRVLEVACGAGIGLGYLAPAARQVVGMDVTARLLLQAQAHYGAGIPLLGGDAQQMPFVDGSFDLILCFEAIYYLQNPALFCTESRRILAADSTLLIALSNPDWPDFVPGEMSTRYPAVPELAGLLYHAGFRSVQFFGILPFAATPPRQAFANHLRHCVLQVGLLRKMAGPAANMLKAALYGRLQPLPAKLEAPAAGTPPELPALTPIPADRPDCVHRVIYALADV